MLFFFSSHCLIVIFPPLLCFFAFLLLLTLNWVLKCRSPSELSHTFHSNFQIYSKVATLITKQTYSHVETLEERPKDGEAFGESLLMGASTETLEHSQSRADDCKFTTTTSLIRLFSFSQFLSGIFPVLFL